MSKEIFKNIGESQPPEARRILGDFESGFQNTVKGLLSLEGVDFDGLRPEQRAQSLLDFLKAYYRARRSEWVMARRPAEAKNWLTSEVEVEPNLIELTVIDPNKGSEQQLRLAPDRKAMLAYFTVLTEQKIVRFQDPWNSRKELASFATPYTLDQFHDHCLAPLENMGILEVGSSGYRLTCNPADVLKILESSEPYHRLEVVGFEDWVNSLEFSPVLIESYHLDVLRALLELGQRASPEDFIDISSLGDRAQRSRGMIYDQLAELEELGLISRRGPRYRIGDVNLDYVAKIVERQGEPIILKVNLKKPPTVAQAIEEWQAGKLRLKEKEEPEFPRRSFRESEAEIVDPETLIANRAVLLKQIDGVLMADLRFKVVSAKDGVTIYSGLFPEVESDLKTTLAILDFLGLGPEELKVIRSDFKDSIGATITNRLEKSSSLQTQFLAGEISARLAGLIMGEIYTIKDGIEMGFATVSGLLAEEVEKVEVPAQVIFEAEKATEAVGEVEVVKPGAEEKLLEVIRGPFERELLFALEQPSFFIDYLPPTAAFNFHRILSNKSYAIPWDDLYALGLAVDKHKNDYHPHLSPAGALVTAIFLRHSVNDRVLAAQRSQKKGLKLVAISIAHLLRVRQESPEEGNGRHYFEACLDNLSKAGLICGCQKCHI